MSKKLGISISIVFILASAFSMYLYFSSQNKTIYADELIGSVSSEFKTNLNSFLLEASKSAHGIGKNTISKNNDTLTHTELNSVFTKQINNNKLLKGVLLSGSKLNYVILKDNNTWATTYSYSSIDTMLEWSRLDNNLIEVSRWSDTYNFFMNKENSERINENINIDGKSEWRIAQSEFKDYRDLIINVFKLEDINGDTYIIGLVYKTSEISGNFSDIFKFQNPLVNIINKDGGFLTPIKTTDTSKISIYKNLSLEVRELLKNWTENRNNEPYSYSFETTDGIYWTRIDTINNEGIKGFIITVSEKDITLAQDKVQSRNLYLSIVLFTIGLLFIGLPFLLRRNKNYNIKPLERHSDSNILDLISKGETESIEFKSSLRYDYRLEKENKILEDVILKSISAFANAKGGTLFIGVDDDLNILGLENDFSTLKKQDADYFELHLRKLINNQYGISFTNESLMIYFPSFEDKIICVIQINSSPSALYLKTKNKQGQQVEKFYVRSGNASEQISSLKEINDYVKRRFGRKS